MSAPGEKRVQEKTAKSVEDVVRETLEDCILSGLSYVPSADNFKSLRRIEKKGWGMAFPKGMEDYLFVRGYKRSDKRKSEAKAGIRGVREIICEMEVLIRFKETGKRPEGQEQKLKS